MKGERRLLLAVLPAFVVLIAAGFMGQAPDSAEVYRLHDDEGQAIYMTRCMSCHMTNGEGVPGVFPPLAGSEYVTGDKGRLIRMILNGLTGEIEVNGTTYSGVMPPWGGFLDDEQMAQVLTYIRTNFGNEADAVTADEVARVRAHVKDRTEAWTADELNEEENLGIPGDG